MANQQSRITVVGAQRRVDIAVPSLTPIGEYAPRLAELCGQSGGETMPPAWSLATAGMPAFPLDASLHDLGVVDGQVLYLHDIAQEPGDAPVVKDIDEVVADETARRRRERVHAGPVTVAFGLLWLSAAAFLAGRHTGDATVPAIVLVLAGMAMLGTGWGLRQKPGAVPPLLTHAVVLSAVPCLAFAGVLVADGLFGDHYRWAGAVAGANLALLMALAVTPSTVFTAVEIVLGAAAVLVALAHGLGADRVETAALVAGTATGLMAVSRRLAATVAAYGARIPANSRAAAEATSRLVGESDRLLTVLLAAPAAALAVTVPLLAASGRSFGVACACVVTVALLARARLSAFTSETVLVGGAALTGVFAVTAWAATTFAGAGSRDVVLVLGGVTVVGAGVAMSALMSPPADADPQNPAKRPRRRSRAEAVGVVAGIAVAPVVMGVFGVFGHLMWVGRTLF